MLFRSGKIEAACGVVNYDNRGDIEECYEALQEACRGFSARLEELKAAGQSY